jgi:hypothetical protein
VADYLAFSGGEWEIGIWIIYTDPLELATVMLPKTSRIDMDNSTSRALLDHLNLVLFTQFRDLAEAHTRFSEAYVAAKGIIDQLLRGDVLSIPLDDAGLSCRLGGLRSGEFLSCARAYIAQINQQGRRR